MPPLSPELLVPRLGEYLVEKGLVKSEDLKRALEFQATLREQGDFRLTGQILIDLGIIDSATRDAVLTELILQLRTALQEANQQLSEANQQLERRVEQRTAELHRAMTKLAEVNQLKANIVANISHELRTPLTHLKGYLELLLASDLGPLTEPQQNALVIMDRSSERLARLIEDLILFSLSEREKMVLRIAPFTLETLCVASIHKISQKANEHHIKLVLECEENLPEVEGDEEKVSWVIQQFLDNAIKFSQAGGTVTLRIHRDDRIVTISVADTGIGIPEARTEEIFDSFHQLDGSTTRRAGGTGLGLALAKKIAEAHGTNIMVTSEMGKGSCFSFSLKVHT
jgi:two-component system sensor histidine kinase/response regulator